MSPLPCEHVPVKVSDAAWVYGTPGIIYARYRCAICHVSWDDVTERPLDARTWGTQIKRNGE